VGGWGIGANYLENRVLGKWKGEARYQSDESPFYQNITLKQADSGKRKHMI